MSEEGTSNAAPAGGARDSHFTAGMAEPTGGQEGLGPIQDQDDGLEMDSKRTYTQEELDKIISRRLKRQQTKLTQDLQEQAQEEARKARMDETERLRVERDEAVAASKQQVAAAQERVMLTEAKAQAAALGVSSESLKYISRLVDLSEVEVDVDGTPDEASIREAVSQVLKDVPALAQSAEVASSEAAHASGGESPVMPMGRDRTPSTSPASTGNGGASALDLFNRRLRQRTSERSR